MKFILLAAGRGSRLGDLTKNKPKCMCELAGKTLLQRCLEIAEQAGVARKDIGIVTGYQSDMFNIEGVTYFHNENWETTNMVHSLTMANEWLEQESCIVCYSDIVFTKEALLKLQQSEEEIALTYYTKFWELWEKRLDNPLEDLETFRLNEKGELIEIGRKPQCKEEIEGQYMGLVLFTPKSWKQAKKTMERPLRKPLNKLDMTTLLDEMIQDKVCISTIPVDDFWLECDTEEDIRVYEREFLQQL